MSPGPGSYRLPSEFGHYESKFAQTVDARAFLKTAPGGQSRLEKSQTVTLLRRSMPAPKTAGPTSGNQKSTKAAAADEKIKI